MMADAVTISEDRRALATAAAGHVAATMHVAVEMADWPGASALPRYLTAAYGFAVVTIGGTETLWLLAEQPVTPATLRKQLDRIADAWSGPAAGVFADLAAHQRQRLVAAGIPFVVPGRQVYLPALGVDLRERTRRAPEARDKLRPAAQALLLWLIYAGEGVTHISNDAIEALGFERMTVSRSIGELEAVGAIVSGPARKPRAFRLAQPPRITWDAMRHRLTSPVSRTVMVPCGTTLPVGAPLAGLSALSEYSELAAPTINTRAWSSKLLNRQGIAGVVSDAEDVDVVEAWVYDPRVLSTGPAVDPLSLYLTLRDDPDERVQQALARMIAEVSW
jgi:hypothetical protein